MIKISNLKIENYKIRTDLAFEALELEEAIDIERVVDEISYYGSNEVRKIIIDEDIAIKVNKKPGLYYTIDTSSIQSHDHDNLLETEQALRDIILEVLKYENISLSHKCLIVGLGNYNVTPDSLGPLVIDNILVTRHMFLLSPEEVSDGISEVSAIAPGVMGTTGIETYDIIEAVVKNIDVDYLIVVDALASRSIQRVNKTIQVTNTGISPGSGVGNKRKELSKETLNIPVIAIGVPTVVDAATITSDTIEFILKYIQYKADELQRPSSKLAVGTSSVDYNNLQYPSEESKKVLLGELGLLNDEDKRALILEVLTPNGYNMMVTPKEIDMDIEDLCKIISGAIDQALHPIVSHS